jgi:hypothetical protein
MAIMTPELRALQRKLERWELEHLRTLAADVAQRLEEADAREIELQRRVKDAEARCDFWHDQAIEAYHAAQDEGAMVGLSVDGSISVVRPPPPTHT